MPETAAALTGEMLLRETSADLAAADITGPQRTAREVLGAVLGLGGHAAAPFVQ